MTRALIVLAIFVPALALAKSVYVNDGSVSGDLTDGTGATWCATSVAGINTSGCGTCSQPCASLPYASTANPLAAGDVVYINTGTYTATGAKNYATITTSGTATAPITLQGAVDQTGKPLAYLDGAGTANTCLWIKDASHIIVRGLECSSTSPPTSGLPFGSGFLVSGSSTDVLLEGLDSHTGFNSMSNAGIDIWVTSTTGTITVRASRAWNSGHGIAVSGPVANAVVDGNRVFSNFRTGIRRDEAPLGTSTTVSDNDVYGNATSAAIGAVQSRGSHGVRIAGNRIFGNAWMGIRVSCSIDGSGVCTKMAGSTEIVGNTVHGNNTAPPLKAPPHEVRVQNCAASSAMQLRDNVVFLTSADIGATGLLVDALCAPLTTSDYNDLYKSAAKPSLTDWNGTAYATLPLHQSGTGQDANSLSSDPLFVDATNATLSARDYHLRSKGGHWAGTAFMLDPSVNSPAIDRADPTSPFANETFCNGGRANLGGYGNSATASRTFGFCALQFITAPLTMVEGKCTGPVVVATTDGAGKVVPVSDATPVSLSASTPSVSFFSDSGCTAAATSLTLAAGATQGSFYFIDTQAGTPAVIASSPALLSATQTQTVTAAPAALSFISASQSVQAGACSAAAQLQLQDAAGNPAPVSSPTPVSLSATSSSLSFFSDASCANGISSVQIASGSAEAGFYFSDAAAGSPAVTATASGLSATQTQTVQPGPAAALVYVTPPQTVQAGACSAAVEVELRDGFGNAVQAGAPTPVAPGASSGSLAFFSDPGCSINVATVDIAAGDSKTAFFFRDTVAGVVSVTASAAGLAATQPQSILPGPPAALVVTTPARSVLTGACSELVTVRMVDAFGNPSPRMGSTLLSVESTSSTMAVSSDACTTTVTSIELASGATEGSVRFSDLMFGAPTLTFTAAGLAQASQQQTVMRTPAVALMLVAEPTVIVAGGAPSTLTATVLDASGQRTSVDGPLAPTVSPPGGTLSPEGAQVAPSGSASWTFSSTQAGTRTLTVTAAGLPPAVAEVTVVAADAHHVRASAAAPRVLAGEPVSIAFQVVDAFSNPVSGDRALEATTRASCALSPASIVTTAAGAASSELRCSSAGQALVCATSVGLAGAPECAAVAVDLPPNALAVSLALANPEEPLVPGGRMAAVLSVTNSSAFAAEAFAVRVDAQGAKVHEVNGSNASDSGSAAMPLGVLGAATSVEIPVVAYIAEGPGGTVELRALVELDGVEVVRASPLSATVASLQSDVGCGCTSGGANGSTLMMLLGVLAAILKKSVRATSGAPK